MLPKAVLGATFIFESRICSVFMVCFWISISRSPLIQERLFEFAQVEQLRSLAASESQNDEKEALEVVAIQLAQERDEALTEIEELKKVWWQIF